MNAFETLAVYLKYPFVQYALIVGVLIAFSSALLGVTLVLKRYSYIGDGLSHVAFGAMAIGIVVNISDNLLIIMPVTIAAAVFLLGKGGNGKIKGDAAIAMLSVSALAFGYFIINIFSKSSNVSGDVCTTLFGSTSILTLKKSDLWICLGMSVLVVAVFAIFYHKIFTVTFDEEFALATGVKAKFYNLLIAVITAVVVSVSMRLVGSLLISAFIIFPALSSLRLFKSFKTVILSSAVLAVVCSLSGIFISIVYSTPVGATIVLVELAVFGIFYLISRIKSGVKA